MSKEQIYATDFNDYGHFLNNGERVCLSIFEIGKFAGLSLLSIDLYTIFNNIAADHNYLLTYSIVAVGYTVMSLTQAGVINSAKYQANYSAYLDEGERDNTEPGKESARSTLKGFIPGYGAYMSLKGKKYSEEKSDRNLHAQLRGLTF